MTRWVSARDLAAPAELRLFCLPHAGSGAAGFYRWKRLLPPAIAVCPILLPGRETRLAEPSLTRISAIIDALHADLRAELQSPYAIFGHSMGALLAYEWVRRIAAEDLRPPAALFVSGRNAPQLPPGHNKLHLLDDAAMLEALRTRYGVASEGVLDDPDLRALFLPILRADLECVETYTADMTEPPLQCPIGAFAGEVDHSVSAEGLAGWVQTTRGNFMQKRFPGAHFFHFGESQAELLAAITAALT